MPDLELLPHLAIQWCYTAVLITTTLLVLVGAAVATFLARPIDSSATPLLEQHGTAHGMLDPRANSIYAVVRANLPGRSCHE